MSRAITSLGVEILTGFSVLELLGCRVQDVWLHFAAGLGFRVDCWGGGLRVEGFQDLDQGFPELLDGGEL